jgi:hypothetical protein
MRTKLALTLACVAALSLNAQTGTPALPFTPGKN